MASPKLFLASLLLLLFAVHLVQPNPVIESDSLTKQSLVDKPFGVFDCGSACKVRCSLSSRPRLCQRACGTCCDRCSCVPPGTYGNYNMCPCYAALTTRGGVPKCP